MNELVEADIHPSSQEGTQIDASSCVPDSSVSDTILRGFYALHSHSNGERIDELSSSESPFLSPEQKKKLKTTLRNLFGFLTIAVASYGCTTVGHTGIEAVNLSHNPLIISTGIPDSATGVAETPTPQDGVQEPTLVDVPFLSPTAEKPTEILLSPTAERSPTAPEDALEMLTWDDIFWRREEIPKDAVVLSEIPSNKWKDLTVTGPGQVYFHCDLKKKVNRMNQNEGLVILNIDLYQPNGSVCVRGIITEEGARKSVPKSFSTLSSEQQELLTQKYLILMKSFLKKIAELDYEPYFDAYYYIVLGFTNNNTDTGWIIYRNPYPYNDEEWTVIHTIDTSADLVPFPTITTTPVQ